MHLTTGLLRARNVRWRRVLAAVFIAGAFVAACSGCLAQQELFTNGDFSQGTDGWMWEQWLSKPLPGTLDTSDKPMGAASFKMGLPGATGDRWLAKQIDLPQSAHGRDLTLTFFLKLQDVPDNAAAVRLAIQGHGFLNGGDLVRTGGTQDWKPYKFLVPASALGDAANVTLFLYHDQVGAGVVGIANVSLVSGDDPPADMSATNVTLSGDTSEPVTSTFVIGEPVDLSFDVEGLKQPAQPVTLVLSIVDENGSKIKDIAVPVNPDSDGHWQTKVAAPANRLGFYRVYARLSDGVELAALGSRAEGFLTYAVVHNPAKRKDYGVMGSRFGMQGGWGPWGYSVLALLGARWVLHPELDWKSNEPDHAGQFGPEQIERYVNEPKPGPWHTYPMPSLFNCPAWACDKATLTYETGTLTPAGEKAWAAYCKAAATAFSERYPDMSRHIYQITWEPIQPWGYKGTNKDLVRIYQIAYGALHAADPKAMVCGPTRGFYNNDDPQATENLFQLGLGKYIDGYTVHDYYSITPEIDGMPKAIRTVKAIIKKYTGHDLPMFGTEQGWSTQEDPAKDITQAQGLIRQSLIALGEGLSFNFGFYIMDYRMDGQKGYGYYYNLDPTVPFGPSKVCPKPIAPAYSAESFLLDGSTSDGAVDWLGSGTWGYIFERDGGRILVLWRYAGAPSDVSVPTGEKEVRVYDWMGNSHLEGTIGGNLRLTLGPEPVYITGVSPALWGGKESKTLKLSSAELHSYPGSPVIVAGSALLPGQKPMTATLSLETETPWHSTAQIRQVALGGNKRSPFRFDLPVPAGLKPGAYAARLVLRSASGSILAATGLTVDVATPLSARIEPTEAGGKPGVAITLQDEQGIGLAGKLTFRLKELLPAALRSNLPMIDLVQAPGQTRDVPQASRTLTFKVPARGSRRLTISLAGVALSPTMRYQVLLNVVTTTGARFPLTAPIDFLTAKHASQTPAIDGDFSAWSAIPAVELSGKGDVVRSLEYYPPNLSAQFRFAWDDHALYIASQVNDDVFFQDGADADLWKEDCLQLAFNLDPGISDTDPNSEDRRTSELTVALTKNGPEVFRALSSSSSKLALGPVSQDRIPVAIKRVGAGGLVYEMAIPWTELGMTAGQSPKAGDTIGFAATVNEVRQSDQSDPTALGIFGGIAADKDVDKHGTLLLGE